MRITCRSDCQLPPEDRKFAARRAALSLSRFANAISEVCIGVVDGQDHAGRIREQCQVRVKLTRGSELDVTASADSVRSAIDQACERASRAVARATGTHTRRHRATPQHVSPSTLQTLRRTSPPSQG